MIKNTSFATIFCCSKDSKDSDASAQVTSNWWDLALTFFSSPVSPVHHEVVVEDREDDDADIGEGGRN